MEKNLHQVKAIRNQIIAIIFVVAIVLTVATASVFAETDKEITEVKVNPEEHFEDQRVIAHGGGEYQGYASTNSAPALKGAIDSGHKLIELDMDFSSDGKVIMIHDWDRTAGHYFGKVFEKKLTGQEFSKVLVHSRFQTMNLSDLIGILAEADQKPETAGVRIVTDTKGDNLTLLKAIAAEYPHYADRIIPQIYAYDQYEPVKAMGYEKIILTLYAMEKPVESEVINFAKSNGLYAVTIPADSYLEKVRKAVVGAGLRVYCHPVETFEEAQVLLREGVYGVYSGALLPGDFEPWGDSVYLTNPGDSGAWVKLRDCRIGSTVADIVALPMAGLAKNQYRIYELDGKRLNAKSLEAAEDGRHQLSIKIYALNDKNVGVYSGINLNYLLWKDEQGLRVLDERYGYRLELAGEGTDFEIAAAQLDDNERLSTMLENSYIAKAGEHYCYFGGKMYNFTVGGDYLEAQAASSGKALIPLAEALKIMGAASVRMGTERYVYIEYAGEKTLSQVGSYFANVNYASKRVATPISIYRGKTMAAGELLGLITGREYIEADGVVVLLPENTKITKEEKQQLLQGVQRLYQQEAQGGQE